MSAPTIRPQKIQDRVFTDPDGDHLEIEKIGGKIYVTVDQNGIIATVGPFPSGLARAL